MADIKSPEERSRNMARIRSKDTKPEEYIRKKLYAMGYRYRKNSSAVFGHPDIWMPKYNVAIFVNGCFWHRHENCKYAYEPKSRIDFWTNKFKRNIVRDEEVRKKLQLEGKRILIIWECGINNMIKSDQTDKEILSKMDAFIRSDLLFYEV